MIGIVIALEEETKNLFSSYIKEYSVHYIYKNKFYIFKTASNETCILTYSGVGKVNAAIATTLLINNFNVNLILNIGSCGSISEKLNVNDILIVDNIKYGDVDVTEFNYEINQVPKQPSSFKTFDGYNEDIIKIINLSNYKYTLGNIYTIDSFVNKKNYLKFNLIMHDQLIYGTDMELASIAQVCANFGIKLISLKIVSDKLILDNKKSSSNLDQYNDNINKISIVIDELIYSIIQTLSYKNSKII